MGCEQVCIQNDTIIKSDKNESKQNNIYTIMKFEDLEFTRNPLGGMGATHTFDNGIMISVQASESHYCSPRKNDLREHEYSSFEVAIFNSDNEFLTRDYIEDADDDVFGWAKRYDIDSIMAKIQKEDSELIKALSYAVDNNFITMNQAFEIIRNIK